MGVFDAPPVHRAAVPFCQNCGAVLTTDGEGWVVHPVGVSVDCADSGIAIEWESEEVS